MCGKIDDAQLHPLASKQAVQHAAPEDAAESAQFDF